MLAAALALAGLALPSLATCPVKAFLGYDLSPLSGRSYTAKKDVGDPDNYTYYVGVCGDYSTLCVQTGASSGGALVQFWADASFSYCESIVARWSNPIVAKSDKGVAVSFANGDECFGTGLRKATIDFQCDTGVEVGNLGVHEQATCDYLVTFPTMYACTQEEIAAAAGGGGWTFNIILMVGFTLYCGGGYAYKMKQIKESESKEELSGDKTCGLHNEGIPHRVFWFETLPAYTRVGCAVSKEWATQQYRKCKDKNGRRDTSRESLATIDGDDDDDL